MLSKIAALRKNKVFQRFIVYVSTGGFAKAVPFLIMPFIANTLTPQDFGLISNFNVMVGFFTPFISMRLVRSLEADYYKKDDDERKSMVSNLIYLMTGIAVILFLASFFLQETVSDLLELDFKWIGVAIAVALGSNYLQIRTSIIRLEEKARLFAKFKILESLLTAGLTFLFIVVLNWTWKGRIAAAIIAYGLMTIITLWFFFHKKWFPKKLDLPKIKGYLGFGLPLLPHAITPFLRKAVDKITITNVIGLASNGIFSLIMALSTVFDMVLDAFFSAYIPMVYKKLAANENDEQLKIRLVKQGYQALGSVLVALFIGYFLMKYGILFFLKEDYHSGVDYIPLFLIHIFLKGVFQLFSVYVIYSKKTIWLGSAAFGSGVVHIALSLTMVPIIGVEGSLYALVLSDILRAGFTIIIAQKYHPMPWFKATYK